MVAQRLPPHRHASGACLTGLPRMLAVSAGREGWPLDRIECACSNSRGSTTRQSSRRMALAPDGLRPAQPDPADSDTQPGRLSGTEFAPARRDASSSAASRPAFSGLRLQLLADQMRDVNERCTSDEQHDPDEGAEQPAGRRREVLPLSQQGAYFFDYGNAFLKAVFDAGVTEVVKNGVDAKEGFVFPSYFEDIMGPIFDYGYGPFRWVCLSGAAEDLDKTDQAAMSCIDPARRPEDRDNYIWIKEARANRLVVGSQARILYSDAAGRTAIALKFNDMVRRGEVGPIILGRDHHDPGGTDSPFRETANIYDGSNVCADMATHCFAGNAARGMSLVALHNGGGTGIGKAINGGFGMVLDGSERVDAILRSAMSWDVMGGVARRNWARNPNAIEVAMAYNQENDNGDQITIPFQTDEKSVAETVDKLFSRSDK